ncbi:regulatory protein YycH of two-component signal transduction system YycFG [Planomicrobium koreense]|uniref:Regulatory protein YycH of two-component signal transduction system YycFG n=1 Tax=Planococcus koreensis TaxID=112331 RepID=A0A7W8CV15_9BACL|nr:two-component system activity regulator YycH [Planococcus koreensis]MBB5180500.1 regulatory protein YycH of two-component signal transduction system YycFG [Planococcus koreensis]
MKYVEQVKTIFLFLLIFLSLALTFTIWTFTPTFPQIESTPATEVALGASKAVDEVVQPTKVLYHSEEEAKGTTNQEQIDLLLGVMKLWQIHDITTISEDTPVKKLTSFMHGPDRAAIYFPGPVPFPVIDSIMNITDDSMPEASFDRIVVAWGEASETDFMLYFINSKSGRVHQGNVSTTELENLKNQVVEPAFANYSTYITSKEVGVLPIYIPESAEKLNTYRYLQEDIPEQKLVDGLFENPSSVTTTGDLVNREYSDESDALMNFDESAKSVNYVQPQAETNDPAIPSELIFKTADFINTHSGWTNDYRYFGMEPLNQKIDYRLYQDNLPVFSQTFETDLEVVWGIEDETEKVFRYKRPYYVLESLGASGSQELPSGAAVLHAIEHMDIEPKNVSEIVQGYTMARDEKEPERLISLQPAWYYKTNGIWTQLPEDVLGGDQFGLE